MKRYGSTRWSRCTLLALLALAAGSACAGEPPPKLRVVLVTLDTLRYDSFAGTPERASEMPRTLALAEQGLRFERFYAATSATQPTHATLFTGLHPWQHSVPRNGSVLSEEVTTLAERFQAAGFKTAAVVASFPLERRFGFAQGFDLYEDEFSVVYGLRSWGGQPVEETRFYSLAADITRRAEAILDRLGGERQFLWFHYFDPHAPYGDGRPDRLTLAELLEATGQQQPDLEQQLARARRLYAADVDAMDRSLARLLRRLAADAPGCETHVVVTADHGESFGEQGSLGHGQRLTKAQVHVPTFLLSPRLEPGVRRDVAGTIDLGITLLRLAGIDAAGFPGRDLSLPATAAEGEAFGMRHTLKRPYRDVRVDGSVLSLFGSRFYAVQSGVLYAGNPRRVVRGDVATQLAQEAVAAPLRRLFAAFDAELQDTRVTERVDAETRAALEALGYVQ